MPGGGIAGRKAVGERFIHLAFGRTKGVVVIKRLMFRFEIEAQPPFECTNESVFHGIPL